MSTLTSALTIVLDDVLRTLEELVSEVRLDQDAEINLPSLSFADDIIIIGDKAHIGSESVNHSLHKRRPGTKQDILACFGGYHCSERRAIVLYKTSLITPHTALLFSKGDVRVEKSVSALTSSITFQVFLLSLDERKHLKQQKAYIQKYKFIINRYGIGWSLVGIPLDLLTLRSHRVTTHLRGLYPSSSSPMPFFYSPHYPLGYHTPILVGSPRISKLDCYKLELEDEIFGPDELTERNLMTHVLICDSLLKRNDRYNRTVFEKITGVAKWITYDKNARKISRSKGKQAPQIIAKSGLTRNKLISCVLCEWKGIVHYELLPPNRTINSDLYCQQLMRSKREVEEKRAEFINRKETTPYFSQVDKLMNLRDMIWCTLQYYIERDVRNLETEVETDVSRFKIRLLKAVGRLLIEAEREHVQGIKRSEEESEIIVDDS
ncbi:Mariner Mos1 transposase [Eumeta japonica]|uniref:Mariner Mos1 transposase n=1 Tax=Eumeta variegata TaxID=151549 RepID=A0A4C1Z553_EUMVA|nr:Mariner Mos1 transposase [Eumeta japonica]